MCTTEIIQMVLHHLLQKLTRNPFKEFGIKVLLHFAYCGVYLAIYGTKLLKCIRKATILGQ